MSAIKEYLYDYQEQVTNSIVELIENIDPYRIMEYGKENIYDETFDLLIDNPECLIEFLEEYETEEFENQKNKIIKMIEKFI